MEYRDMAEALAKQQAELNPVDMVLVQQMLTAQGQAILEILERVKKLEVGGQYAQAPQYENRTGVEL